MIHISKGAYTILLILQELNKIAADDTYFLLLSFKERRK